MKLELKHLAPYIEHNLTGILHLDDEIENVQLTGILSFSNEKDKQIQCLTKGGLGIYKFNNENEYFKPILRPLSDLEEYIYLEDVSDFDVRLVDEFENIIDGWCEAYDEWWNLNFPHYLLMMDSCPWEVMQKLLELNFDVFGLIDKGLAIDINTIKK